MKVSEEGHLQCGVCGFDYTHLVATIEAYDNDNYELTELVVNRQYTIVCRSKKRYNFRSQGNVHLLYRCEDGHFSIISFDGHKGVVLVDQNPLMNDLARFLNEKTKEQRKKQQLSFEMDYTLLGYIE